MLLHQLSEHVPCIFSGARERRVHFRQFARSLRAELDWLRGNDVSTLEFEAFFPQSLLLAFHPGQRLGILNSGPSMSDWHYAAAARFAEALTSGRSPEHPLLREGTGPAAFAAGVLSGRAPSEKLLHAPLRFRGVVVEHFIAAGSTSAVYRGVFENRACALKLPLPGRSKQFQSEVNYLRQLGHRNLPELLAFSPSGDYCVLEHLDTGQLHAASRPATDCLDALKYLHAKNILHGDIRLANLGMKANGMAALFDFSHARRVADRAETEHEIRALELLFATGG